MTKKDLEQLIDLRKEIEEIEQNILKIEHMNILSTNVKELNTDHGYNSVQTVQLIQYLDEQKELLCERKTRVVKEENKLMLYINSIQESRVRRIMQFKYIDGYSWEKIGEIMHFDRRTGERIVNRYLRRQKNECSLKK